MSKKRHTPEENVAKLRQVEILVDQGRSRIDAIREIGIAEQTFYRWRKQYAGRSASGAEASTEGEQVSQVCSLKSDAGQADIR